MQRARNTQQAELAWEGNGATFAYLDQLAVGRLRGRPTLTPQELPDRGAAMTPNDLTTMLLAALGSLVVAVDKYAKVRKGDAKALSMTLDPHEIWQPGTIAGDEDAPHNSVGQLPISRHKTFKSVLWLTRTHLWRRKSGKTKSIELADIVLVGHRNCGCISMTDSRGRHEELPTEVWKRGKKLKQTLLAAFPVETVRMFPEK